MLAKEERNDQLEEGIIMGSDECSSTPNNNKSREQSRQDQRTKMFKRLQVYKHEHDGCCHVPYRWHQDTKLGRWVLEQRQNYKKGTLQKERHDLLVAIGFECLPRRHTESIVVR